MTISKDTKEWHAKMERMKSRKTLFIQRIREGTIPKPDPETLLEWTWGRVSVGKVPRTKWPRFLKERRRKTVNWCRLEIRIWMSERDYEELNNDGLADILHKNVSEERAVAAFKEILYDEKEAE